MCVISLHIGPRGLCVCILTLVGPRALQLQQISVLVKFDYTWALRALCDSKFNIYTNLALTGPSALTVLNIYYHWALQAQCVLKLASSANLQTHRPYGLCLLTITACRAYRPYMSANLS